MLFLYGICSCWECWDVSEDWKSFKKGVQNEVRLSLQSLVNYYFKISGKVYIIFANLLNISLKYTAFSPLITYIVENMTLI